MNEKVIEFSNVSKKFKKGRKLLLKEALLDIFKPQATEDFWALKDLSFDILAGETLGIVGPNGSGKSTILKLIAKVMHPTKGNIEVKGKVAPLIELGAGFHPELTGRENIFLNGVILGMRKKEIENKFERIVNFAGIGEFLDSPLKHYSSGMYVRLGFSIAVHTEPDIILLDEILAVGDKEFREKSMKKMKDLKKKGLTIIYVSHSNKAVEVFCDRVLYIDSGSKVAQGKPAETIRKYMENTKKKQST